ncbi:MAG: DUF4397 domain-containing protein [Chloroflexota bacterium]
MMFKRVMVGIFAFIFSLVVAGVVTQLSSASMFDVSEDGSTILTRTPIVGETAPTRTRMVGESVPTRTPFAGETNPTRTPEPNAPVLQISNFVDFAPGIPNIILKLNGEEYIELPYGDTSEYINVPIGTFLMEIIGVTDSRSPEDFLLAFQEVTFDMSKEYSGIIGGDAGTTQPTLIKLVEDDNSPPSSGKAKLRVGHFAPFNSVLADTEVDVRNENTGLVVGGLSDIPFGTLSPFIELDAGVEYDLIVVRDGVTVLDLDPFTLIDGEIATVVVNGGGANQSVGASLISNRNYQHFPVIAVGDK